MRLLVTGGAGYIGSHFVHLAIESGHSVVVLDDLSTGHADAVDSRAGLIIGSILDDEILGDALSDADAVVHFAAKSIVGESEALEDLYWETNRDGTAALAIACDKAKVRHVVMSSTAAVYGNPIGGAPVDESHPLSPCNVYGKTKVAAERALFNGREFSAVALRFFNAAGAFPEQWLGERHNPETHLIPRVLRSLAALKPVIVYGNDYNTKDGTCVRDYVHVWDLAEAHIDALHYLWRGGESCAFNLGSGVGSTVLDVIRAAGDAVDVEPTIVFEPRRHGDPESLVADVSLARSVLQWEPQLSALDCIVRDAWMFEQVF